MSADRPGSKVVFLHSSNEMFGADRVLLQVVSTAVTRPDTTVEVWLPDDVEPASDAVDARLRALGVTVDVRPLPVLRRRHLTLRRLPALLKRMWVVRRDLIEARADIVYCATSALLLAAPAARLGGARSVVLHMQEIWSGRERSVLAFLAAFCTSAVAISEASRRSLRGPIARRAITVVNAVADSAAPPAPLVDRHGPLRFLVASRWNAWKGHGTLLEAWAAAGHPGELLIAGSPPEQGVGTDIPAMVAALPDPSSVTIVGQVTDVAALIDEVDVMVVPSDEPEPFGLVAIEAFSRGRPVIGSAGGGLLEIVTPWLDGWLFDNRSVAGLAVVLAGLDREIVARHGAAARDTYLRRFSSERFDERFAAVWSHLLGGRQPGPRGAGRRAAGRS